MKKILLSLAFCFLSFSAFSISLNDFSLSVEPVFGMKWGRLDEYVYAKDSNGDHQKQSELNWPIKNMISVGGNIYGGYKKLNGVFHFSTLIPGNSGKMSDSDWMDLTDLKTTYSKSENSIEKAIDFSVLLKYDFRPITCIKIAPSFEFEYKTISFEANNGYGWYGHKVSPHVAWDNPKAVYYDSGSLCGIDYKREVTQIFIGYYLEYQPIEKLRLFETFSICPYAYTVSYDTHYSNMKKTSGTNYADEVKFYFSRLKGSAGCYYALNSIVEFGLTLSVFYSVEKTGTNYQKSLSQKSYTNMTEAKGVEGGAGAFEFDAALSCKINIF